LGSCAPARIGLKPATAVQSPRSLKHPLTQFARHHWTFYIETDIGEAVKPVSFLGDSLAAVRSFPGEARRETGFQIDRVQRGLDPDSWKPMKTVGQGVREIRVRDASGAFRVIYIATLPDAVYVLHAFQKKTQATAKRDLDVATGRYMELMRRNR
jgi:phage-related protein